MAKHPHMFAIGGCGCDCDGCSDGRLCLTVKGCDDAPVSGATVTVKTEPGGETVGTCVTNIAGECCVTGLEPGGYAYSVDGGDDGVIEGRPFTINETCEDFAEAAILAPEGTYTVVVCVLSPCGCDEGGTVTVSDGAHSGSGVLSWNPAAQTCCAFIELPTWGHSGPTTLHATYTPSVAGLEPGEATSESYKAGCDEWGSLFINIETSEGFDCCDCFQPRPDELTVSGPLGTTTLTRQPGGGYVGFLHVSDPSFATLIGINCTVTGGTAIIRLRLGCTPGQVTLTADAHYCSIGLAPVFQVGVTPPTGGALKTATGSASTAGMCPGTLNVNVNVACTLGSAPCPTGLAGTYTITE